MDTQLHEIIAVEPSIKIKADNVLKEGGDTFTKRQGHFKGQIRTYDPVDDDGEKFPDESKELVTTVPEKLKYIFNAIIDKIDVIGTKEETNTEAVADVIIDGKVIFAKLHATTILSFEKEIGKWRGVLMHAPTLEPGLKWTENKNQQLWEAAPIKTLKGKKVIKVLTKAAATKEHPAQTELINEDQTIGTWTTVHTSGAITPKNKSEILERLDKLEQAFKTARQRANSTKINQQKLGDKIVKYLLNGHQA